MRALIHRLAGLFRTSGIQGMALLGVYALSGWACPPLNHLAIVALWGTMLFNPEGRTWLFQHRISRYLVFFLMVITGLSIRGMVLNPVHLPAQILETTKWLMIPGFMAVAYGMAAEPRRVLGLWLCLFLSLLIGLLTHVPLEALLHFDVTFERQPKFQFSRAGMVGLASSVALFGLIIILPRMGALALPQRRIAFLIWGLSSYLTVFMLLSSQSRISWLALLIVTPIALLFLGQQKDRSARKSRWPHLLMVFLALLIAAGALRNMEGFRDRMGKDWTVITHLIQGRREEIDQSASFSLRYRILTLGARAVEQQPWLGWGNVGTSYIASLTGDETFKIPDVPEGGERLIWITHLHSTYLEILSRYGIVGLVLFVWGFVLWRRALQAKSQSALYPREFVVFLGGTAAIMVIWDLTEFRASMEEWRVLFSMLAASTFSQPKVASSAA